MTEPALKVARVEGSTLILKGYVLIGEAKVKAKVELSVSVADLRTWTKAMGYALADMVKLRELREDLAGQSGSQAGVLSVGVGRAITHIILADDGPIPPRDWQPRTAWERL